MSYDPEDSATPTVRSGHRLALVIVIATGGCCLDLVSKSIAFQYHRTMQGVFGADQPLELFDIGVATLSLVREYNTGMAFGYLQDVAGVLGLLLAIRLLFLAWLLWIVRGTAPTAHTQRVSLGILIAGSLGNLSDNLFTYESEHPNAVRDFLLITGRDWSFPAFNLADTWITIGGIWFLWTLHHRRRDASKHD